MKKPKRIKQYDDSISYRRAMEDLASGELNLVFERIFPIPNTKKQTKTISLLEILKESYDEGNRSEELTETLRGAVRMYYQEMCDEGLLHRAFHGTVTGIDPNSEDS